jgi:DNA-binding transcriptional LysR family regulator
MTERDGRRLRLTPQALLVLEHAEAISAQFERVRADLAAFQDGRAGRVAIASFASAIQPLVVPALRRLALDRPGLEATVVEAEPPEAFASLDSGAIDTLITIDYVTGPTHADGRYHRVDLLRDPLVAVLPESHPLAGNPSIDVDDLAREQWVMGTPGHPCVDVTIAAQATAGFTATVSHRANDWAAAAALVASGQGVAFVPELAMRSIATSGISVMPVTPPIARNIYAAVRKGSENAPHVAAAVGALRAAAEDVSSART